MSVENLLAPIKSFLQCETPEAWIEKAKDPDNLSILLIDHLICELNDNMCK
jgi:tRNA-(ms[2]io[6]A)-hydroxylase